jgi:RPA family protein
MAGYDLTRMTELGERYQKLRAEAETMLKPIRAELMAEVEAAVAADVPQVDIVAASKLTRERLRQIRIAKEKAAAKAAAAKKTVRKRSAR